MIHVSIEYFRSLEETPIVVCVTSKSLAFAVCPSEINTICIDKVAHQM